MVSVEVDLSGQINLACISLKDTAFVNDPILGKSLLRQRQTQWKQKKLSPVDVRTLKTGGHIGAEYTASSTFDVTTRFLILNKPHSAYNKTPGNSYISYVHNSCKWMGCITEIIKLADS